MKEFYVTFGCQYARELHPHFPKAHPDGWVTIEADDEMCARNVAIEHLGTAWSTIYENRPDTQMFPRGELCKYTNRA